MKRIPIHIRFQNGLTKEIAERDILNELVNEYEFIETGKPAFILFGPYGNDVPEPGDYTRIGYFCENVKPDMSVCEWAFGIPREEEVNNPHYKRIQWHGLNPQQLIKPADYCADDILRSKNRFCNFFYSTPVPYREAFFKQLSKYKKIDAPGKRLKNMQSIDEVYTGDRWQRKRQFLNNYKFTIAFENYVYPGYQTEKIYDAMQANSLPIYFGDPYIGEVFNTRAFINVGDYLSSDNALTNWLQKKSRMDFKDIRPQFYNSAAHRFKRKLKTIGRNIKMGLQYNKLDFSPVIDRVIELDKYPEKYIDTLKQPWFKNNIPPVNCSLKSRWEEIFKSSI